MIKFIKKIPLNKIALLLVLSFIIQTSLVNAAIGLEYFFGYKSFGELFLAIISNSVNSLMQVASWLLILAGSILDISIRLTLNIKDFVDSTPAIYTVWKNIRDISGLFFIFILLYAAIRMMIGIGKGPSYGSIIKNIVIAGVLINFSFFIVSIAIDASNIVSQAIYNAMIPNEVTIKINRNSSLTELVKSTPESSRISNIFMNSLRIQTIYDTKGNKLGQNIADPMKMILIGLTGIIMMITTAASFILAALAFIARFIILIFLLAFSSVWFVGWIIPEFNKQISTFVSALTSQLIFMPVYLILMYVALSIINGSNLIGAGAITNTLPTGTNWVMPYMIIGINFAIVIFILNLPLVVGLGMGGWATDWLKKGIGRWDAINVWKGVGGWTKNTAASIPQNTVGQGAYMLSKSKAVGKLAAWSPTLGIAASKGLSKVSSASFGGKKGGYEGSLKARKKDIDAMYNKLGEYSDKTFKREVQSQFRTNLPNGLLGRIISPRANKEAMEKLNKIADKEENRSKKKEYEKEINEINEKIKEIEKPKKFIPTGQSAEEIERSEAEKKAELEKRRDELQEKIDKANENENEEKESKLLEKIGKTIEEKGGENKKV